MEYAVHTALFYFVTASVLLSTTRHSSNVQRQGYSELFLLNWQERQDDLGSLFLDALLGGLGGGSRENESSQSESEEPNKVLLQFKNLVSSDSTTEINQDDVLLAHDESLDRFLVEWALLLEKDSGLSTPIMTTTTSLRRLLPGESEPDDSIKESCVRIMFRSPPRYLSCSEQRDMEKGILPDRKGGKLDSKSAGGVQLSMKTTLVIDDTNDDVYQLQLVASRCAVDEDTIVKL
eukprot:scaffold2068_cov96-Cylindrotheca_fusiformis.AAC.5